MPKNKLILSETFYSLQGEGPSVGHPAVFLRLSACNLSCEGFSYQDPKTGEHLGCDTKHVWKKGKPFAFEAILEHWKKEGWTEKLSQGAHLVITGGEPLLQQTELENFLAYFPNVYLEMETNGTIRPNDFLSRRVNQFNVSPKLCSSGESQQKAYQEKTLRHFSELPQAIFKFVIQNEKDVQEVIENYQKVFLIPNARIWLMPEGGTQTRMQQNMPLVAEACKTHGFCFSPRLHIHLWDEATGV